MEQSSHLSQTPTVTTSLSGLMRFLLLWYNFITKSSLEESDWELWFQKVRWSYYQEMGDGRIRKLREHIPVTEEGGVEGMWSTVIKPDSSQGCASSSSKAPCPKDSRISTNGVTSWGPSWHESVKACLSHLGHSNFCLWLCLFKILCQGCSIVQ